MLNLYFKPKQNNKRGRKPFFNLTDFIKWLEQKYSSATAKKIASRVSSILKRFGEIPDENTLEEYMIRIGMSKQLRNEYKKACRLYMEWRGQNGA